VISGRFGRTVGVVAAGVVLAGGLGACARSITGSAAPAGTLPAASSTTAPAGGASTTPSPTPGGTTGDLSKQAQQTCALLPKDPVKTAFGVPDVAVTADSGTTLAGGIQQVKCVLTSTNGFRANVVVQIYPATTITTADQYYQSMQRQFSSVQKLSGISGADTAGMFQDQDPQTGATVDEAFAAKKDTSSNTVDVVIAGVPDSPGITTKLVTFITALTNS
jgi:hypothetical protein